MAQEQPGGGTLAAGHVRVAPRDLDQAGQQFRAQAQNLEQQVSAPLNAVEQGNGAAWTSGSHTEYLRLHTSLLSTLRHAQQTTHHLGVGMSQSGGAYGVLNQTRFNAVPAVPGDGLDPFNTIRVAGQARPPTLAEVQALQARNPSKVTTRALTADEAKYVGESEDARTRALAAANGAPSDMRGKCWAADEDRAAQPIVSDELEDEEGGPGAPAGHSPEVPSGYQSPRAPYPQLTKDVVDYSKKLPPEGYTLRPNSSLDTYIDSKGNVQGGPGFFNASHAEKQASMRGDFGPGQSKRIGINLGQCRDCRTYFWATAKERDAAQFVSDPYVTRIYYPNGDVGIVFDPVGQEGQQTVYVIDKELAATGLKSGRLP